MPEKAKGLFVIESTEVEQLYNYSIGKHGAKFFKELKNNKKILGVKCSKCNTTYVPPRNVCGPCFEPIHDLVEVGPQGTITLYTILRFHFLDSETGEKKPVPYGYGLIRLDNSDTNFQHFIAIGEDESKVKIGARVRAVFADQREGSLRDIVHFVLI